MSNLISSVTPQTAGILWLRPIEVSTTTPEYQAIDYLLDGLLTATSSSVIDSGSKVIIGKNFNRSLTVFIVTDETKPQEFESFFSLIKKDLKADDRILVVDDMNSYEKLRPKIPKDLLTHFHL